eukprot:TRINITY_DN50695_c0_g1_i1.p1 TRINITY_DN50695_c0_g1~~TRINITY_DN50695_c0_g1_i1.p1  ORF type:complete len:945 (+),score=268.85 TRINITY_DN50695_c0_g1_i1:76-2835(+)
MAHGVSPERLRLPSLQPAVQIPAQSPLSSAWSAVSTAPRCRGSASPASECGAPTPQPRPKAPAAPRPPPPRGRRSKGAQLSAGTRSAGLLSAVTADTTEGAAPSPSPGREHSGVPRRTFSSWPSRAAEAQGGFALQLEQHLDGELRLLRHRDPCPGQRALLRVHQETLWLFASHFGEYSGVLSRIVREYEKVLEIVDKHEVNTQSLRDQVERLREEAAARAEEQARQHDRDMSRLRRQAERLREELQRAREQLAQRESQVVSLSERCAVAEREVEEGHMRNMLVTNALRESSERQHKAFENIKRLTDENRHLRRLADSAGEDIAKGSKQQPAGETAFLKQEIVDLKAKCKKLTRQNFYYKAQYARAGSKRGAERPVTPRPHWELLLGPLRALVPVQPSVVMRSPKHAPLDDRDHRSDELLDEAVKLVGQLGMHIEKLQSKATFADITRAWIGNEDTVSSWDLETMLRYPRFRGRGTGPQVPKYLRWYGPVLHTRMPKAECERMIKAVWAMKAETENAARPVQDLFLQHCSALGKGDPYKTMEFAYNCFDSLKRYRYDGDCLLFLLVLRGKLPEDTWRDQEHLLTRVQEMFASMDPEGSGVVRREDVKGALGELLRDWSHENILRVRLGLEQDQNDDDLEIRYADLFQEDADHNQGPFVEALRQSHVDEILDFQSEVVEALRRAAREKGERRGGSQGAKSGRKVNLTTGIAAVNLLRGPSRVHRKVSRVDLDNGGTASPGSAPVTSPTSIDADGHLYVSLFHIKEALVDLDPEKPEDELRDYLARGMRCATFADLVFRNGDDLTATIVNVEDFIDELLRGPLKRTGCRTGDEERRAVALVEEQRAIDMDRRREYEELLAKTRGMSQESNGALGPRCSSAMPVENSAGESPALETAGGRSTPVLSIPNDTFEIPDTAVELP